LSVAGAGTVRYYGRFLQSKLFLRQNSANLCEVLPNLNSQLTSVGDVVQCGENKLKKSLGNYELSTLRLLLTEREWGSSQGQEDSRSELQISVLVRPRNFQ